MSQSALVADENTISTYWHCWLQTHTYGFGIVEIQVGVQCIMATNYSNDTLYLETHKQSEDTTTSNTTNQYRMKR